ncbi:anti-sigma factor family protein [Ferviditalea candida]|uniref:Zf-HC2 domain-containing protein n=1 Tax=Ferviditalea candida TaxID=3108399 RepID=A0ABU5ZFK0_9BACL|nr:zf-HC2 domain-containing protein [Paenibacillaceae bacterium T2]
MKCNEVQERFGEYNDLPVHDLRRQRIDEHIRHCSDCAEEFRIWEESADLIKTGIFAAGALGESRIASNVMSRIYMDESWRIPVADRTYNISSKMRRNLTAVMAFCLTMFIFSFIYSIIQPGQPQETTQSGNELKGMFPADMIQDAHSISSKSSIFEGVPVASITAPNVLRIEPPSYPHYWMALSIFGVIFGLLTMNWLSRIKY